MAQFAQRLGLDLPDPLPGHIEILPHLFEGMIGLLVDAETHLQDLLLAGGQGGQNFPGLLREIELDHRLGGGHDLLVFDEIAQVAVLFLADGRIQ